jgi:hypothetical protein
MLCKLWVLVALFSEDAECLLARGSIIIKGFETVPGRKVCSNGEDGVGNVLAVGFDNDVKLRVCATGNVDFAAVDGEGLRAYRSSRTIGEV